MSIEGYDTNKDRSKAFRPDIDSIKGFEEGDHTVIPVFKEDAFKKVQSPVEVLSTIDDILCSPEKYGSEQIEKFFDKVGPECFMNVKGIAKIDTVLFNEDNRKGYYDLYEITILRSMYDPTVLIDGYILRVAITLKDDLAMDLQTVNKIGVKNCYGKNRPLIMIPKGKTLTLYEDVFAEYYLRFGQKHDHCVLDNELFFSPEINELVLSVQQNILSKPELIGCVDGRGIEQNTGYKGDHSYKFEIRRPDINPMNAAGQKANSFPPVGIFNHGPDDIPLFFRHLEGLEHGE